MLGAFVVIASMSVTVPAHGQTTWASHRLLEDVVIDRVRIGGRQPEYGEVRKDVTFIYGRGVSIRISTPADGRMRVRAGNISGKSRRVELAYSATTR